MKKVLFTMFCLLLLTGCNDQDLPENNIIEDDNYFWLEPVKTEGCSNQVKEYYENQGRKVYFVCLDEIYVKRENAKAITLKYHFDSVNQSFDSSIEQLINQMEIDKMYKDGGSKLYQKDNYRILECKTGDGNRDVYFGDITLEYENDYCVNN